MMTISKSWSRELARDSSTVSSDVLASFCTDFNVCCTESEKQAFFVFLKMFCLVLTVTIFLLVLKLKKRFYFKIALKQY